VWYLLKKDTITNKIFEDFNTTINNHLDHSTAAIEKNNETNLKISRTLQRLCTMIGQTKQGERGEKGDRGERGFKGERGER
jgi:hypothetical protein